MDGWMALNVTREARYNGAEPTTNQHLVDWLSVGLSAELVETINRWFLLHLNPGTPSLSQSAREPVSEESPGEGDAAIIYIQSSVCMCRPRAIS